MFFYKYIQKNNSKDHISVYMFIYVFLSSIFNFKYLVAKSPFAAFVFGIYRVVLCVQNV